MMARHATTDHTGSPVGSHHDDRLADLFAALASPVRLSMLRQLQRETLVCACGFDVQETIAQSTVSHHLRVLRETGLVRADRSGTFVHYSLEPDALDRMAELIGSLRLGVARPDPVSRCCEAIGPTSS